VLLIGTLSGCLGSSDDKGALAPTPSACGPRVDLSGIRADLSNRIDPRTLPVKRRPKPLPGADSFYVARLTVQQLADAGIQPDLGADPNAQKILVVNHGNWKDSPVGISLAPGTSGAQVQRPPVNWVVSAYYPDRRAGAMETVASESDCFRG
jgi:hypothetical protein